MCCLSVGEPGGCEEHVVMVLMPGVLTHVMIKMKHDGMCSYMHDYRRRTTGQSSQSRHQYMINHS